MQLQSEEDDEPLVLVEASVDMPLSIEALVDRVTTLVQAPRVEAVVIRPEGIAIKRWMPPGTTPQDAVPRWTPSEAYGADALLERVLDGLEELPVEFLRDHPHLQCLEATQRLERRGLVPVAILAPQGPLMASWLGSSTDIRDYYLGCRVIRGPLERYSNKIVVLGAPLPQGRQPRLDDIAGGVAIDISAEEGAAE